MKKCLLLLLILGFSATVFSQHNAEAKLFYDAIGRHDMEKIDLYTYVVNVNYTENSSSVYTPLMVAVNAGYQDVVELLISKGAKVNMPNCSSSPLYPLSIAVKNRNVAMAEFLLNKGADPMLVKKDVQQSQNKDLISLFSRYGVTFNYSVSDLAKAAGENNYNMCKTIVESGVKPTPECLINACWTGNKSIIDIFLSTKEVNINTHWDKPSFTVYRGGYPVTYAPARLCPICVAVMKGKLDLVKWMVEEKGASVQGVICKYQDLGTDALVKPLIEWTDKKDIREYLALAPAIQKKKEAEIRREQELEKQRVNQIKASEREKAEAVHKSLFDKARKHAENNEYQQAVEAFISIYKEYKDVECLPYLTDIYYKMGEYQKALDWCQELINRTYKSDKLLTQRGHILMKLQRFEEALSDFEAVLKMAPSNEKKGVAYVNLAEYYVVINDLDKAVLYLKKAKSCGYNMNDVRQSAVFKILDGNKKYQQLFD